MFSFLEALDIAHPWLLLLILPGTALLFFKRGGHVRMVGAEQSTGEFLGTRLRRLLPSFFFFATLCFLGLSIADVGRNYKSVPLYQELVSRLFVTQDNSGSMFGNLQPHPLHCVWKADREDLKNYDPTDLFGDEPRHTGNVLRDAQLRMAWERQRSIEELPYNPRIEGSCVAHETLYDEIEKRAARKEGSVHHEISMFRFGISSAIQEPITSDYRHLREVMSEMNWRDNAVGGSTNTHYALYDMLFSALRRHIDGEPGYTQIPKEVFDEMLGSAIAKSDPRDDNSVDYLPHKYPELFAQLGEEMSDTVFLIITDATEGEGAWKDSISLGKMIRLAHWFHAPVFVISTEENDPDFKKVLPTTGTAERPGEFFLLNKLEGGYKGLGKVAQTILDRSLGRTKTIVTPLRDSWSPWCAGAALVCLMIAFFLRESAFGRTLTA